MNFSPITTYNWSAAPAAVLRRFQPDLWRERPIDQIDSGLLAREIDNLPAGSHLVSSGPLTTLIAFSHQIPHLLREIGRLREITFRAVGEGSGLACDLDKFDDIYEHLIVWDRDSRRVVGAYRVGHVDRILRSHGLRGLYTATQFRYDVRFLHQLGGSIELGRSFVTADYQRKPASLLMLWRGIGAYVARHPECPCLFGPVSISREYSLDAREVIVSYLRARHRHDTHTVRVRPKTRFRGPLLKGWDLRRQALSLSTIDDLDRVVSAMTGKSGLPILLRQYLNLGGRVVDFNVDRAFSNVLDALIIVDLRTTDLRHLQRYLGKDGAAAFLQHHSDLHRVAIAG